MTPTERPLRLLVAALADLKPVRVREHAFAGPFLATLVAVNPTTRQAEADRTAQLICELARLVASAARDREVTEVEYRAWRDGQIHELTNDLEVAANAGSACAPGDKAKPPSREAAEG